MSDYRELSAKVVTVRKHHRCAWCAQRIEAGDKAHFHSYVFDGCLQSDWMHPECHQAMKDYPEPSDLQDGWIAGEFERPTAKESA